MTKLDNHWLCRLLKLDDQSLEVYNLFSRDRFRFFEGKHRAFDEFKVKREGKITLFESASPLHFCLDAAVFGLTERVGLPDVGVEACQVDIED